MPSPVPTQAPAPPDGLSNAAKGGLGILGIIILIAIFNSLGPPSGSPAAFNAMSDDALMGNDITSLDAPIAADPVKPAQSPPSPPDPWSYSTSEDKVRGATTYFASTTSTNTIRQDSPYDSETTMEITLRKSPAYGTDVVLSISSGQLMCPSYEGCSGTVRFDDGPARKISFSGPADNSSDTIFVDDAKSFITRLKASKHVVIEKTLYEAGNPQFEFDVRGLKWAH